MNDGVVIRGEDVCDAPAESVFFHHFIGMR